MMTSDDAVDRRLSAKLEEAVKPLRHQIRWLRHAIQRLLFINGLVCGLAAIWLVLKLVQAAAG